MGVQHRPSKSNGVIGVVLVVVGALLLAGQVLDVDMWRFIWPLFVIAPGVAMLGVGAFGASSVASLAIPGSMVTMTGLILLYQSVTGHWGSWTYVWSLIFPVSLGIGLIVAGRRSAEEGMRKTGESMTRVGLIIFLVAGVFFELVLRISAGVTARLFWPAMLVLAGVYLVLRQTGLGRRAAVPARQGIDVPPAAAGRDTPAESESAPAQE